MALFLMTVLVFGLVIGAMAVGVIAGRAPIKGSCGGMGALGVDAACEICGGNPQRCEEETRGDTAVEQKSRLYYPADE
ncbi:MAG: (Na+)-NQR maturation NqrM [Halioglobus sp.]|nr:(Na+)-NQR maturation NqrM [Halioglobus sp.]